MFDTSPPTRQRYYSISFALEDGDGGIDLFHLPIKPEELTRQEPARVNVTHTFGGAWIDSFGRGLMTITLSGNTGWRSNNGMDGVAQFVRLRDDIVKRYHDLRKEKSDGGLNPMDVRLMFVDPLNGSFVGEVVPTTFTLRRSKSHPLLLMYTLVLTVISEEASANYSSMLKEVIPVNDIDLSQNSFLNSATDVRDISENIGQNLTSIGAFGADAHKWTQNTFAPVLALASDVIRTAGEARTTINEAGQVAVDFASDLSAVGATVWESVVAVASLPIALKTEVLRVKGAFSNLHCVLANGYKDAMNSATGYSQVYGASNCSSTLGGRPESSIKSINPFDETSAHAVHLSMSSEGREAINEIKNFDRTQDIDVNRMKYGMQAISYGLNITGGASSLFDPAGALNAPDDAR